MRKTRTWCTRSYKNKNYKPSERSVCEHQLSQLSLLSVHWLPPASRFILTPAFPISSCYLGKGLKKSSTEIVFSEQLAQPVKSTKTC